MDYLCQARVFICELERLLISRAGQHDHFGVPAVAAIALNTPAVVSDPGGLGIPFKFGTFNFVNGLFFGYATFDVTFTTYSQDPQFNGRTFSDTILYQLSGSQTFVTFRNHPNLIPLVLNGSGSVDLWGAVNSLDPLFFANPTGGITIGTAAAVPESSEWILMLSGLVVMGQFAARRRNRRSA